MAYRVKFSVCAQLIQYETYEKETRLVRSIRLWVLLKLCIALNCPFTLLHLLKTFYICTLYAKKPSTVIPKSQKEETFSNGSPLIL